MIAGIGVDLVDIARARALLARQNGRVLDKLCTAGEAGYVRSRPDTAIHLAARLAAKEAAFKALSGSYEARGIGWKELEVVNGFHGEPSLAFHGRAAERARVLGVTRTWVTLTHSATVAVAVVVLERD